MTAPTPLPNRRSWRRLREAWDVAERPAPPFPVHQSWAAFFLRTEPELVLLELLHHPRTLLMQDFELKYSEWPEAAQRPWYGGRQMRGRGTAEYRCLRLLRGFALGASFLSLKFFENARKSKSRFFAHHPRTEKRSGPVHSE